MKGRSGRHLTSPLDASESLLQLLCIRGDADRATLHGIYEADRPPSGGRILAFPPIFRFQEWPGGVETATVLETRTESYSLYVVSSRAFQQPAKETGLFAAPNSDRSMGFQTAPLLTIWR